MHYILFEMSTIIVNTDLTLTTEKLVELFETVDGRLVDDIGLWLDLPNSKINAVGGNYRSLTQRRDAYLDLYTSNYPYPSWKKVAEALRGVDLHRLASVVERSYVQGTIIAPTTVL